MGYILLNNKKLTMNSEKQIMAELIPSPSNRMHLNQSVLLILSFQGLLSVLMTSLVYLEHAFEVYMNSKFWILYLSAGVYVFLTLTRFLWSKMEAAFSQLSLFLIILFSAALDATAAGQSPVVTLQVIIFLFSGVVGLFIYLNLAHRFKAWYWGIVIIFLVVDLAFAGFCLGGFSVLDSVIWAAVGMGYAGLIYLVLQDGCERYKFKVNDWASATIFVYFDILIVPYVLTKLWKFKHRD
jgi:hypothetical protein